MELLSLEFFALAFLQMAFLLLLSPLLLGIMRKVKAVFQGRRGAPVFQPYFDLAKLMLKGTVSSRHSTWITRVAPSLNFASVAIACLALPVFSQSPALALDLIAFAYLFAIGRFLVALEGLDAASAFGALGSSREMLFAAIIEPALFLLVVFLAFGAVSEQGAQASIPQIGNLAMPSFESWEHALYAPAFWLAAIAFFIIIFAELGRLPFDNPATHLELTMVHEAMILEYSGPQLALIEWAQAAKATLFFALGAIIFLPIAAISASSAFLGALALAASVLAFGALAAMAESFTPKLRLFKAPEWLVFALVCAGLALLARIFENSAIAQGAASLFAFAMLLLSIYLIFCATFARRIELYFAQSLCLAFIFLQFAWQTSSTDAYFQLAATIIFKLVALPLLLLRAMNDLAGASIPRVDFDSIATSAPVRTPGALLSALALVLVAFSLSYVFQAESIILPIALSIIFVGLLFIAVKSHVLLQLLGLLVLENGLVLLPHAFSIEVPLIGAIAALFDTLVLAVVAIVLSFKVKAAIESLDSQKLDSMRESA